MTDEGGAGAPGSSGGHASSAADGGPPSGPERLVPQGNRLRPWALVGASSGTIGAVAILASRASPRLVVPVATVVILFVVYFLCELLGSFDDRQQTVRHRAVASFRALVLGTGPRLARAIPSGPVLPLLLGVAGTWGVVVGGVTGVLPRAVMAVAMPAAFLMAVVGFYRLGEWLGPYRSDEQGRPRPLLRRHGFWLVVAATLLYLPMLGSHSLSDPWEAHYGEVSREILARNDWISLWWAQDGWFFSKPVLLFWMQSAAMATTGVAYAPGQMLSGVALGREPAPEWAMRMPIFLVTVLGAYLLYKGVARTAGRRAGFLGGLVLLTMPQFFLVAHQTMTDMPFVATTAAAIGCLLVGLEVDPDAEVSRYEVALGGRRLRVSAWHLVVGGVLAVVLPQILYLASRNLSLAPFGFVGDTFASGSPGNCGLPGNDACRGGLPPAFTGFQPVVQALVFTQAVVLFLYLSWGERRKKRIAYLGAWFFAALAMMAKGPAGIVFPVLCALFVVFATRRFAELARMEISAGLLLFAAMSLPWIVAMYVRHGSGFTDQLIFHHFLKRAFEHVHDTNTGDDVTFRYYVWQLGYATFPWSGLAALALLRGATGPPRTGATSGWRAFFAAPQGDGRSRLGDALLVLGSWAFIGFALFSVMGTKFHHYGLPVLPPVAMLCGIFLDGVLGSSQATDGEARPRDGPLSFVAAALAGANLVLGIAWLQSSSLTGALSAGSSPVGAFVALTVTGAAAVIAWRFGGRPAPAADAGPAIAALAAGAALATFVVGRDLAADMPGRLSNVRLMQLFTYAYKRPWPESLDFSAPLWAFTFGASICLALLMAPRLRRLAIGALVGIALLFAAWGIDAYLVHASPHWGQRELFLAYERQRVEQPGELVAYQMNWKGENFYRGNHVAVFVQSGKKFTDYMRVERARGGRVFYFVTEHTRVDALQGELGQEAALERLTTPVLDNKFLLVRASFPEA